jgi:hypothetical protein
MPSLYRRSWTWLGAGLVTVALAGCGQSQNLGQADVPLLSGARVLKQIKRCDQGSNVFCALDMVVADPRYQSAGEFLKHERRYLRRLGWSLQEGEIKQERSAVSPGRKIRIVYATAAGDLLAIDEGWIRRPSPIALALSRTMFDGVPAISLMVAAGPA